MRGLRIFSNDRDPNNKKKVRCEKYYGTYFMKITVNRI